MDKEYSPTVDDLMQEGMLPSLLAQRDRKHFLLDKQRRGGHCTEDAACRPHAHVSRERGGGGAHYPTLRAGDVVRAERRSAECGRRPRHMMCMEVDDVRKEEMLRRQIEGIRARILEVIDGKARVIVLGRDTPWRGCEGLLQKFVAEHPEISRGYLVFKNRELARRARDAAKGTAQDVRPEDLEVIKKYDPEKPIFAHLVWRSDSTELPSAEGSLAQQTLCPDRTSGGIAA